MSYCEVIRNFIYIIIIAFKYNGKIVNWKWKDRVETTCIEIFTASIRGFHHIISTCNIFIWKS